MIKHKFNLLLSIIVLVCCLQHAQADVKTAKIFSSNMVLQQGKENPIWGWADKNEKITIQFADQTIKTKASKDGKWQAKLPSLDYGGPYTMTIQGKNKIEFENILIGEVWICSGQSNMAFTVSRGKDAEKEIEEANFPNIRLFTVPREIDPKPQEDLNGGKWEICSPEKVGSFSAVGYFFGRKIHKDLNVPIGLINTSWGGTVAESWTSSQTIKEDPDFKEKLVKLQNIDMNKYKEELKKQVLEILGEIPEKDNGLQIGLNKIEFDDSTMKTINATSPWENQGYSGIDGIGWYRKSIQLSENDITEDAIISLGKIDDSDVCFFNGITIGKTNGYNIDRTYKIPKELLKAGKNTIAVKVTDTGGGGGITSKAENVFIKTATGKISLSDNWKFKITEIGALQSNLGPNDFPTLLYNGMINPIIPYGIKGAIWYQGESNASRAKQYQRIFPNMIKDWRNHWQIGDFPFIWVQLANYKAAPQEPVQSSWAELREAQTMTLSLPNTGMGSAIDIGEAGDIHPKNKQDVGKRLALNALKIAYNKDIVYTGPTFKSMEIDGRRIILTFNNTGKSLLVKDKYGYINGFAVAGKDQKFYWAKAQLKGKNQVVVFCGKVKEPVAVRYGWADNPDDLNLYNNEELPANPFRTDDWPGITQ